MKRARTSPATVRAVESSMQKPVMHDARLNLIRESWFGHQQVVVATRQYISAVTDVYGGGMTVSSTATFSARSVPCLGARLQTPKNRDIANLCLHAGDSKV
jgi:hypothetical protein